MEKKPIQDAARRARRERKLGENPVCMFCGTDEFWALIKAPQKILQEHHVAGRAHDSGLTACICQNCHARIHEILRSDGISLRPKSSFLERLAEILAAIGSFLRVLADRCVHWAERLLDLVRILDERFGTWRETAEAR